MWPLEGITVVALEHAVAAPFATRQLADLGARVIKVERRGRGDFARGYDQAVRGLSSYFAWLNRSKESISLDLRHPAAAEILDRLLSAADVLVQNLRPGLMAELGLDAGRLKERYPRLVACDVTGYGEGGPYAGRKAYDLIVQCEVGLASVTGSPSDPAKVGISVEDIAAGMYAFSGILAALYRRRETGLGGRVEVSLLDALAEWMGAPAYYAAYGGQEPVRAGMRHATITPYGPYAARDGKSVVLAVQTEDEWGRLARDVLELPALAEDPRFAGNALRIEHRDALEEQVAGAVRRWDREEIVRRLDEAQIARGFVNTAGELFAHPQLRGRGRFQEVSSPVGAIEALRPPIILSDMQPRMDRIPAAGEDTREVLRSLGYEEEAIAAFAAQGVV